MALQSDVTKMLEDRARLFPEGKIPQAKILSIAKDIGAIVAVDHRTVLRWGEDAKLFVTPCNQAAPQTNSAAKPVRPPGEAGRNSVTAPKTNGTGNGQSTAQSQFSVPPDQNSNGASGNGHSPAALPPVTITPQNTLVKWLPKTGFTERNFSKGETVYAPDSENVREVYLVVSGRFLTFTTEYSSKVGLTVVRQDDLFGFDCMWGRYKTMAECLDAGTLLCWPAQQLEGLMVLNAQFVQAFSQMQREHILALYRRIDQFATMKVAQRLAAFLVELAEQETTEAGKQSADILKLEPYTHELLSEYVGTSREIVTHYMNEFRNEGYLRYTRKMICLYNPQELLLWTASGEREPESEQ